jgi:hypothetical protein
LASLAVFFDSHEQPGGAGDTAEQLKIPAVIRAAASDAAARAPDSFFDRSHSLLGVNPLFMPTAAVLPPRRHDPHPGVSPPGRKTVRDPTDESGGGLNRVQQRRQSDE